MKYLAKLNNLTMYLFTFFSEYKDISTSEELVLNTVITINNLSFYNTPGSAITERQIGIARCKYRFYTLLDILLSSRIVTQCSMIDKKYFLYQPFNAFVTGVLGCMHLVHKHATSIHVHICKF